MWLSLVPCGSLLFLARRIWGTAGTVGNDGSDGTGSTAGAAGRVRPRSALGSEEGVGSGLKMVT